jgi:hypothetical protein
VVAVNLACPSRRVAHQVTFTAIIPSSALRSQATIAANALTSATLQTAIQNTVNAYPEFTAATLPTVLSVASPSGNDSSDNSGLIAGLVVGVGGAVLLVLAVVSVIHSHRVSATPTSKEAPVALVLSSPTPQGVESSAATLGDRNAAVHTTTRECC